jgi:hypothetical protein
MSDYEQSRAFNLFYSQSSENIFSFASVGYAGHMSSTFDRCRLMINLGLPLWCLLSRLDLSRSDGLSAGLVIEE